jgi:hypothetical protein
MDIVLDTQKKLNLSENMKGSVEKSRTGHNKVFGDYTEYTLKYKSPSFVCENEAQAREYVAKNEFYSPAIAEGRLSFLSNGHITFVEKSQKVLADKMLSRIAGLVSATDLLSVSDGISQDIKQEKIVRVYPEVEVKVQLWSLGSRIGETKNSTKVFANYFSEKKEE